jgi:hypothetical protein
LGFVESEGNQASNGDIVLCEVFEKEFMALLTAMEVSHYKELVSSSKLGNRENKELKGLSCLLMLGYYEA